MSPEPLPAATLDELERLAEAATPGPWQTYWRTNAEGHADCGVFSEERPGMARSIARAPRYETKEGWGKNGGYICACDPPTILALVSEVRSLRALTQNSGASK